MVRRINRNSESSSDAKMPRPACYNEIGHLSSTPISSSHTEPQYWQLAVNVIGNENDGFDPLLMLVHLLHK